MDGDVIVDKVVYPLKNDHISKFSDPMWPQLCTLVSLCLGKGAFMCVTVTDVTVSHPSVHCHVNKPIGSTIVQFWFQPCQNSHEKTTFFCTFIRILRRFFQVAHDLPMLTTPPYIYMHWEKLWENLMKILYLSQNVPIFFFKMGELCISHTCRCAFRQQACIWFRSWLPAFLLFVLQLSTS